MLPWDLSATFGVYAAVVFAMAVASLFVWPRRAFQPVAEPRAPAAPAPATPTPTPAAASATIIDAAAADAAHTGASDDTLVAAAATVSTTAYSGEELVTIGGDGEPSDARSDASSDASNDAKADDQTPEAEGQGGANDGAYNNNATTVQAGSSHSAEPDPASAAAPAVRIPPLGEVAAVHGVVAEGDAQPQPAVHVGGETSISTGALALGAGTTLAATAGADAASDTPAEGVVGQPAVGLELVTIQQTQGTSVPGDGTADAARCNGTQPSASSLIQSSAPGSAGAATPHAVALPPAYHTPRLHNASLCMQLRSVEFVAGTAWFTIQYLRFVYQLSSVHQQMELLGQVPSMC